MKRWKCSLILVFFSCITVSIDSTEEAATQDHAGPSRHADQLNQAVHIFRAGAQRRSTKPDLGPQGVLPERLLTLLKSPDVPDRFRDGVVRRNFSIVSPYVFKDVPTAILVQISAYYLATCKAEALSVIVKQHPTNVMVTRAVLSSLDADLANNEKRTEFITKLGLNSDLSVGVQSAIGEAAARWWGHDMDKHSKDLANVGTPLLAALPPGYLLELSADNASHILTMLRNYPWNDHKELAWSEQPYETKRVWMVLFKNDAASGRGQLITEKSDGLHMLWAGATPDEIRDLQYTDKDKETLTKLSHLTKLQAREFMTKLFRRSSLSSHELNQVFDWMLDLSPAVLQRFLANDTDFSNLPSVDLSRASVPTLKQILEQVVASGVIQDRIKNPADPGSWGRGLKDVGRLAYLVPAGPLRRYSEASSRLPVDVLSAIDTYKLTALQTRYLTNKGEFLDLNRPLSEVKTFHGLTKAISTAKLAGLRTSTVSTELLLHLIESIPATHNGRSASLFNKVRDNLYEPKVLNAVLRNPEPGQFLSLLSSREIDSNLDALEKAFESLEAPAKARASLFALGEFIDFHLNKKDDIVTHFKNVPYYTLTAILHSVRRNLTLSNGRETLKRVWNLDTLLSPKRPLVRASLLGLSCVDVAALDLVDLPIIVDEFNRRLKEAGLAFPKRLQHCLQNAMEEYLDMKSKHIRRFDPDMSVMAPLDPSDIVAFGGYLMATLRPAHVRNSKHAELIIATIGALPPQDIIAAVPDLYNTWDRTSELARELIDLHNARQSVGYRTLYALGNLQMFLPPDIVTVIKPEEWKVFVESAAGRPNSLAVCAPKEKRDAWHRLIIKTFGSPSEWSAGVVAAVGDLMLVLPQEDLAKIRLTSWRDAADTLAQRSVYHLPTLVRGSDYPLRFMDVCRTMLPLDEQGEFFWTVRRLARYYLRAAQELVDTLKPASALVRQLQARSSRTHFSPYRHRLAENESLSPRASSSSTPSTTTTTDRPAVDRTTEEPGVDKTTLSTTTTMMEDPFGNLDDFLAATPEWLQEAMSTTARPVPPPKTVIVQDDAASLNAVDETSSTTTVPENDAVKTTGNEDLLVEWSEAKETMPALNSPASTSSTWLDSSSSSPDIPLAMTLPSLTMYPNRSDGGSGAINLSESTVKFSETTEATSSTDGTVGLNLVRRRRGTDLYSDTLDTAIEKDVQVQVSCDAVRTLGGAASLALVRSDAEHMLDVDAEDCVEELSKLRLGKMVNRNFWVKVLTTEGADRLADMGYLASSMSVEEVSMFNFSFSHERILDTLSVVGQYVLNDNVLAAVAKQVVAQNPSLMAVAGAAGAAGAEAGAVHDLAPDAESLLVSLGSLICWMPLEVQRLLLTRRGALMHAARALQSVRLHCNDPCMTELSRAAMSENAWGHPSTWTATDVHDMGALVSGLTDEEIKLLERPLTDLEQPISGITASAITCMTWDQVKSLGDGLVMLTPVAATALTPIHHTKLTLDQEFSVFSVRTLAYTLQLGKLLPGEDDGRHVPFTINPPPESAPSSGSLHAPATLVIGLLLATSLIHVTIPCN